MHGLVTLHYGDGEYPFRLSLGGIAEIENKFDKSIFVLAGAVQARSAKSAEIFEIIRVGLIGGGMSPVQALQLVRLYGDQHPLEESRDVAHAVIIAGLARVHSKELADADPGEQKEPPASLSGSISAPSSAPQP